MIALDLVPQAGDELGQDARGAPRVVDRRALRHADAEPPVEAVPPQVVLVPTGAAATSAGVVVRGEGPLAPNSAPGVRGEGARTPNRWGPGPPHPIGQPVREHNCGT